MLGELSEANSEKRKLSINIPIQLDSIYNFESNSMCNGRTLNGSSLDKFIRLDPRIKLKMIRKWLENIYGEEYSRANVCGNIPYGFSNQGLINIEELKKGSIRKDNINRLSSFYEVDAMYIIKQQLDDSMEPSLFIGKEDDKEEYFWNYYLEHGKNHVLDKSDYQATAREIVDEIDIEAPYKVDNQLFKASVRIFVDGINPFNVEDEHNVIEFDEIELSRQELKFLDSLIKQHVSLVKARNELKRELDKQIVDEASPIDSRDDDK